VTSLTVEVDIRSPKRENKAVVTFLVLIPKTKQAMINWSTDRDLLWGFFLSFLNWLDTKKHRY